MGNYKPKGGENKMTDVEQTHDWYDIILSYP